MTDMFWEIPSFEVTSALRWALKQVREKHRTKQGAGQEYSRTVP